VHRLFSDGRRVSWVQHRDGTSTYAIVTILPGGKPHVLLQSDREIDCLATVHVATGERVVWCVEGRGIFTQPIQDK
jgi:hypothetical protein